MNSEIVLLKLGGSLVTFKSKKAKADNKTIARLAKEIAAALKAKPMSLIIGHGGGSFPHFPAHKYSVHKGITGKDSTLGFAITQDSAAQLNRIIVAALLKEKVRAVSFPPSSWTLARKGEIELAFTSQIRLALEKGMVPVVYGDPALDMGQGICILSTEKILSYLALEFGAQRTIMATRVDMVFTGDPQKNKKVEPIPEITSSNFREIQPLLSGANETDVTGGMSHKVGSLVRLSASGVKCEIAGGMIPGNIKNALLGKPHKSTSIC
ncbi:MAG: isopentenyl phosphate kinase [Candidatus Micrarchaeota archaeon]